VLVVRVVMLSVACVAFAVEGNTAVITPESAEWVTDVAPATVKKLAVTPVNVYPDVRVRVIVAV
jgi:hypothetical protein